MALTPEERSLRARIAAHERWAHEPDRAAATAAARSAFDRRFERIVDPNDELAPAERATRADNAKRAHMTRLAYLSSRARRRRSRG